MHPINMSVLNIGLTSQLPVYVYDLARLRDRCRKLQQMPIAHKRIFFATMANDHPAILSCIRDCGFGVFVNSLTHLRLVLSLGFESSKIIYAASNMLLEEMQICVNNGVILVLDSIRQVRTLGTFASSGLEIGVRLSVGSALDRDTFKPDPAYRFGLLPEELPELLEATERLRIVGVHSYFGTGLMRPDILLRGLTLLAKAARALPDLRYLDVGGGFGVPDALAKDEFDIQTYARVADDLMWAEERRLGRRLDLFVEPGRYLVADCGYFFVRVVDCKIREDRVFVGTNGCVSNFPRALIYPELARHPCEIVGSGLTRALCQVPIYVCGNSTYSQDFLARAIELPLPQPGEVLVFHNAGAYCRSMISGFLGKDRPEEVCVEPRQALNENSSVEALAVSEH